MCLHVGKWFKKFFYQDNVTIYNEVRFVGTNENFATVFLYVNIFFHPNSNGIFLNLVL